MEGFVGDSKHITTQIVDVVAMHAIVANCSVAEAIKAAGRGYLDRRQHEGRVRRAIKNLKLNGVADTLRAAAAADISAATTEVVANALPMPVAAPKKRAIKDTIAPEWAALPGPDAGGERYRVRCLSLAPSLHISYNNV